MNLMFSGLFGVGFVIVRYRKNGVLKRLRATPLGALEFLFAQLLSRVLITLVVSLLVFCAAYWLLDVPLIGSGWLLLVIALAGGTAMASLGLLIAARLQNEELASGLLNLISLPMMFYPVSGSRWKARPPGCSSLRPGCPSARSSKQPAP